MFDEAEILVTTKPPRLVVNGDDISSRVASARAEITRDGVNVTVELSQNDDTVIEGPGILYVTRDVDVPGLLLDFLNSVDAEALSAAALEASDVTVSPMSAALEVLKDVARDYG